MLIVLIFFFHVLCIALCGVFCVSVLRVFVCLCSFFGFHNRVLYCRIEMHDSFNADELNLSR